ncbi:hypothetical protein [Yersinia aldovae]|uniref:hypothetical protein n=1 Tax=Yersinia aldovae TaxID=29483 RepID=UPI0011A5C638|nr:hypothetical protein [Yersinia aldovae]
MVSIITTGGSLGISHYNEIKKMSSQNGVLTVRNNGKENCLTAGRSLAERFIIVLNSTCLGSLSFIKGLYAALEHREAKAIECFSAALVNIYGEGVNDIVNTHLNVKGKIELFDISTIIDKVTKAKSSYRECDDGDGGDGSGGDCIDIGDGCDDTIALSISSLRRVGFSLTPSLKRAA